MTQVAYREAGGFPLLLQLIDGCMTPRDAEPQQPDLSVPAAAVDALSTLARNNAGNRWAGPSWSLGSCSLGPSATAQASCSGTLPATCAQVHNGKEAKKVAMAMSPVLVNTCMCLHAVNLILVLTWQAVPRCR